MIEGLIPNIRNHAECAVATELPIQGAKDQSPEPIASEGLSQENGRDSWIDHLRKVGMKAGVPLWEGATCELAEEFISQGKIAILVSDNTEQFNDEVAGREFDTGVPKDVPDRVVPRVQTGEIRILVHVDAVCNPSVREMKGKIILCFE